MHGRAVYVCNLMSGSVSVIDPDKKVLKKNIPVGKYPVFSLVYPPDEKKLLVTLHNYKKKDGGGRLLLVDPQAGRILQTITYPGITMPSGMVWDRKREVLYVADENLNCIWIHDGRTLNIISSLAAGTAPAHIDISRNCNRLFAANRLSSDLYIWDLEQVSGGEKDARPSIIPLTGSSGALSHPFDVKVSGKSYSCFITDYDNGELLVADAGKTCITGRIRTGKNAFGIALDSGGARAYVCNMGGGSLSVVVPGKKQRVGDITGLCTPCHVVIDEDGGQLVVSDQGYPVNPGIYFIGLESGIISGIISDEMIKNPIGVTLAG